LQRLIQVDEPMKQDQSSAAERAVLVAQRAADSAIAPQPPASPKILDQQGLPFPLRRRRCSGCGTFLRRGHLFTTHSERAIGTAANPRGPSKKIPFPSELSLHQLQSGAEMPCARLANASHRCTFK